MEMIVHTSLKARILQAQVQVISQNNLKTELDCGAEKQLETKSDGVLYFMGRIWVPNSEDLRNLILDEAHKTRYSIHPGADKMYHGLREFYWWPGMKKDIACWKPSLTQSSPWKGVVRFGKRGKHAPRYVGPFEILERIGPVAYKLKLPQELRGIHDTFHVSNLKKCLGDDTQPIRFDDIRIDDKLHFVEEPIEIVDRDVKKLKQNRIRLVKVKWNYKQGPEFTWELEDQMKQKYPNLFQSEVVSTI
ncbi:uncharacterized protein LOC143616591 [Bidens hawaiensis]|uniref:uncharacterized protein LOC143616591 n=1 Tax=Bidens hawaiensis TaxID=980011 RepID=UPI00404A7BC7